MTMVAKPNGKLFNETLVKVFDTLNIKEDFLIEEESSYYFDVLIMKDKLSEVEKWYTK